MQTCAELVGRLDLRPVPAVREDVQRRLGDLLQRDEGTVQRVDAVLASPGEQSGREPVNLAPEHPVLGPVRVPERRAHGRHRLVRAGRRRVGEALLHQLVGDQALVDHHRGDERPQRLPRRVGGEVHQPLDALGRVGVEQAQVQPARPHEHEPADPLRVRAARTASRCRRPGCCRGGGCARCPARPSGPRPLPRRSGSSCRRPGACRSGRSRAGRRAGCGSPRAKPGSAGPKLDHADAPGPPPCSMTSGSPPPTAVGSPAS